jgi:predicted AlkP superfamily phosphohydrolase/phosphomutase
MNTPRTLIIGLDGATFDLIKPWAQAGYLPTLARLMTQGVHGPLLAWPNMNSAAAWTSMVTGCNPGQHGVYDFGTAAPQRGVTWRPTTAASRAKHPFWHFLSAAGQDVGIVNVPISYPADPVNGFMLAGMDAPGVNSPGFAQPPELRDELRRAGIDYILDAPKLEGARKRDPQRVPDLVRRMVDARARTILHLMKTHAWDTLMAVFVATDRMQHFYWPGENASFDSADWTAVRCIYEQIDAFLDDALKLGDENTTVLLVSDHGFGPSRYATETLNRLLEQLGLVRYHHNGGRLSSRLLRNLLLYGRRLIPLSLQPLLARAFPKLYLRSLGENVYWGIDWSNTQVFVDPYGGQVYINLQGREVEGIVSPEEYDALRERVHDILAGLTDAASGKRVVRAVQRREALYQGPYSQEAADLLIHWDYEVVRDSLCYYAEGEPVIIQAPKGSGPSRRWTGGHRPQGIFIACGPHIKRGATVANACIYDIAPTILYLQGHPIPEDMDGRHFSYYRFLFSSARVPQQ